MINEILKSIDEMMSAAMKVSQIMGEVEMLNELSGTLDVKIETYMEEKDYEGAKALINILRDDVLLEMKMKRDVFYKEMEIFKQKSKKLKNVCRFHGINIQLGTKNKIIQFNK